jgi:hypothetical protein
VLHNVLRRFLGHTHKPAATCVRAEIGNDPYGLHVLIHYDSRYGAPGYSRIRMAAVGGEWPIAGLLSLCAGEQATHVPYRG